jgi:hypothetical protein
VVTRALLAAAVIACGCRANESRPQPGPSAAKAPTIGSVTVDEVRPLLPTATDFADVRTVTEPTPGKAGRVGMELCFDTGTAEDTWNKLRDRVTALGWGELFKQNRAVHGQDTIYVAGRRAPYTLTGEVVRAPKTSTPGVPECDGSRGQTLVILTVHRAEGAS